MKLLLSVILILLSFVGTLHGETYLQGWESPQPAAKIYPQYLLVTRYWSTSSGCTLTYPATCYGPDWAYVNNTYQTIDEVVQALNAMGGSGLHDRDYLIGLWKLGESANIIDKVLQLDVQKHERQKVIEKQEWTDYKWRVKP